MKKILNYILVGMLISFTFNCEEDATSGSSEVVTFQSESPTEFIEVGGTKTASVVVYTGNISGSDRTFGISVDPSTTLDASAYSVPSSVTVSGGTNEAVLEYQITDNNIPLSGAILVLNISDAGDLFTATGNTSNASIAISVEYEFCPPSNQVFVDITTDNWPDETTWTVEDSGGNQVAAGGPYDNPADDFTTISSELCLPAGTYTFTLFDSFGDGGSSYEVTSNSGTISGSVTTTSVSDTFTVN